MRNVTPVGPYKDLVLLPSPHDRDDVLRPAAFVRFGVYTETFRRMERFRLGTAISQYYGNVQDGVFFADLVHAFRGLERPLMHEGNMHGDRDMVTFSWVPPTDYEWNWSTQYPDRKTPPRDRVFVVRARHFTAPDEHDVAGAILHWTWIDEDRELKAAPVDWKTRFTEKLWSKHRQRL